ncbi:MAG: AraC family transcriptional regulator, partial [Clostridia bacterium]|nr:AraC family transcriptional regulator [Clostridia bacterium]
DIVGFSTLRNFNKQFQKHMGCTPSEYQKKQFPL